MCMVNILTNEWCQCVRNWVSQEQWMVAFKTKSPNKNRANFQDWLVRHFCEECKFIVDIVNDIRLEPRRNGNWRHVNWNDKGTIHRFCNWWFTPERSKQRNTIGFMARRENQKVSIIVQVWWLFELLLEKVNIPRRKLKEANEMIGIAWNKPKLTGKYMPVACVLPPQCKMKLPPQRT